MTTVHSRHKIVHDEDGHAASSQQKAIYCAGQMGSESLKLRIDYAIDRQAKAWGIRPDQASALLFDRRAIQ